MATLELDLAEEAVSAPAKKGKRLGILFWAAIVWMIFIFAVAIFATLLPIPDPATMNMLGRVGSITGSLLF